MAQISYGTITITDTTDITGINVYYTVTNQSSGITRGASIYIYTLVENPVAADLSNYYEYDEVNNIYNLTTDQTIVPNKNYYIGEPHSIWQTEYPVATEELPYIWEYEEFVYGDYIEPTYIEPRIIYTYAKDGQNGQNGQNGASVVSIRKLYFLRTTSPTTDVPSKPSENYIPTSDTTVVEGKKYYNYTGGIFEEVIDIASNVNPFALNYYELDIIYDDDGVNKWTTVVPTYQGSGRYYECEETILDNGASPIYSDPTPNYELTDSQQKIAALERKGNYILESSGLPLTIAKGIGGVLPTINELDTYGYNTAMDDEYFAIRYNDKILTNINSNGITFNSAPQTIGGVLVEGSPLMVLDTTNGISMFAPPTIENNQLKNGAQLMQLNTDGFTLYDPSASDRAMMELTGTSLQFLIEGNSVASFGQNGISIGNPMGYHIQIDGAEVGFYENETGKTAYVSGNQLYIGKTVVLNEMMVGTYKNSQTGKEDGEWAWRYDNPDDGGDRSIYLKWLGN